MKAYASVGIALFAALTLTSCLEGGKRLRFPDAAAAAPADTALRADAAAVDVTPDVPVTVDAVVTDDVPAIVAGSLSGLRWELPCGAYVDPEICEAAPEVVTSARVAGIPGALYRVRVRIRGVVEEKTYTGGQAGPGLLQIGGTPVAGDWNTYALDVSDPPARFYLNRGASGHFYCTEADYEVSFEAAAGAWVTLTSRAYDALQIPNIGRDSLPIRPVGVPPYPSAFDGQFLQMDVLAVEDAAR